MVNYGEENKKKTTLPQKIDNQEKQTNYNKQIINSNVESKNVQSDDNKLDFLQSSSNVETSHPLDFVVENIKEIVTNNSSDEEDFNAAKINYTLQLKGFKVVKKENGADCEIVTNEIVNNQLSNQHNSDNIDKYETNEFDNDLSKKKVVKFYKGHRRACSMPTAHKERALLVVAEDQIKHEGSHKRHVIKYRLHPYKPTSKANEAINTFIDETNFNEFNLPIDSDELEVEMNEEEMVCAENCKKPLRIWAKRFWEPKWKKQNFELLPPWLQDNDHLRKGHRPPLPSFTSCFKSIFLLHTETGNIWTHMYGCVAFIGLAAWFLSQPSSVILWQDKAVFAFFFAGAIFCLGFSFTFHTVQCHSEGVAGLFSKLDYSGISMLIVGSFVPWIYYAFYCLALPMTIYITMIVALGIAALVVSLWDKFAAPKYRPLRAIVFLSMGLSSVFPAIHLLITNGFVWMIENVSFHWLLLMGLFYIIGVSVYTTRFPECFCPGKCDYFFHSHQFFHLFVIIAAFVHFYGTNVMAMKRLESGSCTEQLIDDYGNSDYHNIVDRWFRPY